MAELQPDQALQTTPPTIPRARPPPVRALTAPQQQAVLDLLHATRFADHLATSPSMPIAAGQ